MVREILIEQIMEMQIRKDFKRERVEKGLTSYRKYKKDWIAKK